MLHPTAFRTVALFVALAVLVAAVSAVWFLMDREEPATTVTTTEPVETAEASPEAVREFCGKCHAYPPPDCFPRSAWRQELRQAYDFVKNSSLPGGYPSLESVHRFYESRAPREFTIPPPVRSTRPPSVAFTPNPVTCPLAGSKPYSGTTFIDLVHLSDRDKFNLLLCDAWSGRVLSCDPNRPADSWKILAELTVPARATVADLDGDGIRDVLVADLGYLLPTNAKFGQVVWLRGKADGSYIPIVLAEGLGRVADVQAIDFRGNGKLDLVVAAFGGRTTGETILLENQTTDWSKPRFSPRVLDDRHGGIHIAECDLNRDGKRDFVALISQEHETVVAFINRGNGEFAKETIYTAPHPAFGCSGIQMIDLNRDGRLDVLLTNGDSLDPPVMLKPFHGVRWLENRGGFPFTEHFLGAMPGVMRALAADIDGDGDQDIIAVSYLSTKAISDSARSQLDSIVFFEQTSPGSFEWHAVETGRHEHMTCVLGDWKGDGKVRLITGTFGMPDEPGSRTAFTLWEPQPRRK